VVITVAYWKGLQILGYENFQSTEETANNGKLLGVGFYLYQACGIAPSAVVSSLVETGLFESGRSV
jgi:hypothetical protein